VQDEATDVGGETREQAKRSARQRQRKTLQKAVNWGVNSRHLIRDKSKWKKKNQEKSKPNGRGYWLANNAKSPSPSQEGNCGWEKLLEAPLNRSE